MLLLISAITLNAWAEDKFHEEWRRINTELNVDDLMKGVDHDNNVIDLRNQAHKGIDPETLGSSRAEGKNVELSVKNKRPQELQNQGRASMRRNQEVTNLLSDLQKNTDRSQPGVDAVFKKAEKIVEQRTNLGDDLSQYLKEKYDIDIGCTSTQGSQNPIDNPFIIGEEVQEIRNETYEPQYCEHLLNTYDCTTDLNIKCLKQGHKTLQLDIKEANFGYRQEDNWIHFDYRYNAGSNTNFERHRWASNQSYTYNHLATPELKLVFEIPTGLQFLHTLELTNIHFSHAILIRFNSHTVHPANWHHIRHHTERRRSWFWSDVHSYHKNFSHKSGGTKYWDFFPRLDYGTGSLVVGIDTNANDHRGNIDLKGLAREGRNELIIQGGSIRASHIIMSIHSLENKCFKWSEKWLETCTLQPS